MRTFIASLLFLLTSPALLAQAAPHWLEDQLYGGGKLNAVVVVVAIILLGIGLWLWAQDRRLKRMEEKLRK